MNKAVFLDRDGVINEMVYYEEHGIMDSPFTPEQVKVFPRVGEAVNRLAAGGYQTIMVTNQPGMAKGQYGREMFERIKGRVRDELDMQKARLDAEYYCLHHPDAVVPEYKTVCNCRKPEPGFPIVPVLPRRRFFLPRRQERRGGETPEQLLPVAPGRLEILALEPGDVVAVGPGRGERDRPPLVERRVAALPGSG